MPPDADLLDCMIVGAGPAGLTAATYLARFRRHILVADGGRSRARWIPASHNCPGFPFGVAGNELLARFRLQAESYGAPMLEATIDRLVRIEDGFIAHAGERHWRARSVILATGVVDRLPDLDDIEQAIADGSVRLCAVCDAYEARDHCIGVLAPASTALGHARFLRTFSSQVFAIDTVDTERTDPKLRELARASGVQLYPAPVALRRFDGGCEARFADGGTLRLDTLYPVLGADPGSAMALELGARKDDSGALIVDDHMQTSIQGLYAIGDVVSALNQISVAVGHAALAATAVHRRLAPNYR